jgi:cell division protein FtsW (lipid II flippase)
MYFAILIFGFVSMVLSQTRNAEGAFVVAVLMMMIFASRMRTWALVAATFASPLILASILMYGRMWRKGTDLLVTFLQRDQSGAAVESLSGRTEWWRYGFEQLMHHPLTGIGAYGGRFAVLAKLGVGSAAMMHSDWVEVAIGTSIWGLIPFAAALLGAWWFIVRCVSSKAFSEDQRQLALECFGLLALLTVHSFFNDEMSWHVPLLYFSILGYAEYIRRTLHSLARN